MAVKSYGQDVGVAGDTARALLFYAAKSGDTVSRDKAKALLDAIWTSNQDTLGVSSPETRADFLRSTTRTWPAATASTSRRLDGHHAQR